MTGRKSTGSFTVRDTDPLVREHRVHDVHIMPGVSLFDMVCKLARAQGVQVAGASISDVIFYEPVITQTGVDSSISLVLDRLDEHTSRIEATSVPSVNGVRQPGPSTKHMTGLFRAGAATAPVALPPPPSGVPPIDVSECYRVTHHLGIHHDDFMKCRGSVISLPSGGCVARVSLGERAWRRAGDFLLHPVFLDCSTIVPLFFLRGALESLQLYIPFAVRRFHVFSELRAREVLVHVGPPVGDATAGQEVIYRDFAIHHLDGRPLVAFEGFGVKRVRSLDTLRPYERIEPRRVDAPAFAADVAPTAAAGASDVERLLDVVGDLVRRVGKVAFGAGDAEKDFFDTGLDSLALLDISVALEKRLGVKLYPTLLFEQTTARALATHLSEAHPGVLDGAPPKTPPLAATEPAAMPSAPAIADGPTIAIPRWLPCAPGPASRAAPGVSRRVVLTFGAPDSLHVELAEMPGTRAFALGEGPWDDASVNDALAQVHEALGADSGSRELYFVVPGRPRAGGPEVEEVGFRCARSLISGVRSPHDLTIRLATFNAADVDGGRAMNAEGLGLWGLLMSLSREHPHITVAHFDLDAEDPPSSWLPFVTSSVATRQQRAQRAALVLTKELVPFARSGGTGPAFRKNGVYVVIGGGRGVGFELAQHLVGEYDARVAIIGRRPLEGDLAARIEGLSAGRRVSYHQASVTDEPALAAALSTIAEQWGPIHGIVHSAMVLEDRRLADMDEACFVRVLAPKVAGAQALARITEQMNLDFLLFFSSVQSFIGNFGQGNYAAASTLMDGIAAKLARERAYPVVTINWGYWDTVGAVEAEKYRDLMRQVGMFGLRPEEAMDALEEALGAGLESVAIVRAAPAVLGEMGLRPELILAKVPGGSMEAAPVPNFDRELVSGGLRAVGETTQYLDALLAAARRRIAGTLKQAGFVDERGRLADVDASLAAGRLARNQAPFYRALLQHIGQSADLADDGDERWRFVLRELAAQFPAMASLGDLAARCIASYGDLLAGRVSGMEIVFPKGSTHLLRAVYGAQPVSAFYNQMVARAVVEVLGRRTGDAPARILEIGAGTGGTTRVVLAALREASLPASYAFTDLWERFLVEARAELEGAPGVTFGTLDIEVDPAGHALGDSYDVVIATNVLHATRNVAWSLRHAKKLLKKGGVLVINESTEVQEFSTYTFGTLPGWWHSEDAQLRLPSSPLLDAATWTALLTAEGFRVVEASPPPEHRAALGAQRVFLAVSDGAIVTSVSPRVARTMSAEARPRPSSHPGAVPEARLPAGATPLAGAPPFQHLKMYRDGQKGIWILLDHAPANMFTVDVLAELCRAFGIVGQMDLRRDTSRFVFLSHCGHYFSLGGDRGHILASLRDGRSDVIARFVDLARELSNRIVSLDALVVAVAHGTVQGGGLETLFNTDLQIVGRDVKLGLPEVKSGLIPGMGGLSYLKRKVGAVRAKRMVLLGELMTADKAAELGLVSHVVDDPLRAAQELEEDFVGMDAAIFMKRILNRDEASLLTADLESWAEYLTHHQQSIDARRIGDSQIVLSARRKNGATTVAEPDEVPL
jgi:enoyl-CoA hydratase/carnithine racemase/NAD(P)-dependent dehydrogenase (short-subunit alcohol dehydrogenase family)/acyl carrier protein/SAM-dependent methyltransferase